MATHAAVSGQGIFNGEHQGMTQVQGSCDIRWRNNHDELLLLRITEHLLRIGMEELLLLPPGIPSSLYCLWLVLTLYFLGHYLLLPGRGQVHEGLLLTHLLSSLSFFQLFVLLLGLFVGLSHASCRCGDSGGEQLGGMLPVSELDSE